MNALKPNIEFSPEELARIADLRYVLDDEPGIQRQLNGKGFIYFNGHGRRLRDQRQLRRIETLAIPPAWTDVWICRHAAGHLQATGRDLRGRKQYLYHEAWREVSNAAKFWRLKAVPRFLPQLRCRIPHDLRRPGLSQTRVLAGMVALLDLTSIRIGNEEYVRENGSYGLATLRNRHVTFQSGRAVLHFRAKGGSIRQAEVTERRLVRLLKELKRLPGARVFQYRDTDGGIHSVDSAAVNSYLHERTRHPFTAKDFRTWKASAVAAGIFYRAGQADSLAARKRVMRKAINTVSEALGNTPTICRKYYVHSGLIEAFLNGDFPAVLRRFCPKRSHPFGIDEQLLATFLRKL